MNTRLIEQATKMLLEAIGVDLKDPNFDRTPQRVARAYQEILGGVEKHEEEIKKILEATFPSEMDELIVVGPHHTWSLCPHHLLPVEMFVYVGYVPSGNVLGLSKLPRLADIMARRPALQEQTTVDIADCLMKHLKPLGVMVVIRARHLCMVMRGIKSSRSWATTSTVRGCFRDPTEKAREEFLEFVKQHDAQL